MVYWLLLKINPTAISHFLPSPSNVISLCYKRKTFCSCLIQKEGYLPPHSKGGILLGKSGIVVCQKVGRPRGEVTKHSRGSKLKEGFFELGRGEGSIPGARDRSELRLRENSLG